MRRIRLRAGVYLGAAGLFFGGAAVVWGASAGWVAMLLGLFALVWGVKVGEEHWWGRSQIHMTWPYALAVLAILLLVVAGWGILTQGPMPSPDNRAERPVLDIRCINSTLPAVVPPSGSYNLLNIFHNGREFPTNIATVTLGASPGSPLRQARGDVEWATICTITNYGTEPLFSVTVPVEISLMEAIAEGDTMVSGKVLKAEKTTIQIARIDAGPDHAYVLFIQAQPPNFASLNFGPKATVTTLARESKEVGISQPDNAIVRVFPPTRRAVKAASSKPPVTKAVRQLAPSDRRPVEANRRAGILRQLTQLYIASNDGISPRMASGMELPPADFLNAELERSGERWRVKNVNGPNAETYDVK